MPKFKLPNDQKTKQATQQPQVEYSSASLTIPHAPPGMPMNIPKINVVSQRIVNGRGNNLPLPGAGLKRAVNYYADHGGCGFWRMIWPELLINATQKGVINGLTTMVAEKRFYNGIQAVRLQRQATPDQLKFVNYLKAGGQQDNFKLIYEIDDIIFKDDIPDFNRCKVAFEDENILKSSMEIMRACDEISVTCQYMKDYYMEKTGNKNIIVIPNYAPKVWADGLYDKNNISKTFDIYKKRPRIGYCGSGTHVDVTNRTGQKDDFTHIVDAIIKTRKDYKWVFLGCYPFPVKPFIDSGEMEFISWAPFLTFPKVIKELNLNLTYAPLVDCNFNRAKSNIKYLEAACLGIPGVYQDMVTYQDAPVKFKTGNEFIDQIKRLLKDKDFYMKTSKQSRAYADTMWLDDHLDEYLELYFTKYGSPERKALLLNN